MLTYTVKNALHFGELWRDFQLHLFPNMIKQFSEFFHHPIIKVQKSFVSLLRQEVKKVRRQLGPLYPRVLSHSTQYVRTTIPLAYTPQIRFLLSQRNK